MSFFRRIYPHAEVLPFWHREDPEMQAQRLIWAQQDAAAEQALLDQHRTLRRDAAPGELPCPQCRGRGFVQDPTHYVRGDASVPQTCDYCLGSGIR